MSDPGVTPYPLELRGRRVLIVGLAREGTALARYLARQGVGRLAVTDLKPSQTFSRQTIDSLTAAGVELVLGEHPLSLLDDAQIVFVSPGVPFHAPFLEEARVRGIPLSTESRLFCQMCPAPVTALTGSSGKTTTTTMVGLMAQAAGRTCWVGGNIGKPLIEELDRISAGDDVVMELSSFQLEYFHPSANEHVREFDPGLCALLAGWSPPLAAILNITPNHLDRHASMQEYVHAKRALVAYRRPTDVAILGADNELTAVMAQTLPGDVRFFSRFTRVPRGSCLSASGDELLLVRGLRDKGEPVCRTSDIRLRGAHNVSNALAALAVADAMGLPVDAMHRVCTTFTGVEHRLELVAERAGVRYYNDSIATSPERLEAALHAFDEPVILLAGGRDKHLPWETAADLMLERARHVILFGEAAGQIAEALTQARARREKGAGFDLKTAMELHRCVAMQDAVALAAGLARPGQVVLLSPGCTSFDAFSDFAQRGDRFRSLVRDLPEEAA